ncbi:MAG TPA: YncE family protein [Candidatus Angelobacter sp.]|jgi:DNA-binding beta-propeller fold protein YncE|nr:YncE family protein [Candidatus Angelobacter sp.]
MRNPRVLLFVVVLSLSFSTLAVSDAKLKQVAMIDLPGDPGFSQVALANGQVVITRPETNTVEIFNPVKRRVVARISQIENPRGIAVDDSGGRIYIAMATSNRIASVKTSDWQVEKLIPVQHPPEKLLWAPENRVLYVSSLRDQVLTVVDPQGGVENATIEMNALPQDMIFDSSRHKLLVSLEDQNQVVALDSSNKIVERFKVAGSQPTGLALDTARRRLYVAVRFAVLVLNADDGSELARIAAPGGTDALILDSQNTLLYAAGGDGSVLAIDLARNVIDHELPTEVKGFSIAYDPNHKMLFFPGGREGRSKLVILRPVGLAEQNAPQTAENPVTAGQTAMKK